MASCSDLEKCTIGNKLNKDCHKTSYCKEIKIISVRSLPLNESELIQWRSNVNDTNATICLHHKEVYLNRFASTQTSCCDPTKQHSKNGRKRKGGLKEVTLAEAKQLRSKGINLVPGNKLCPACNILLSKKTNEDSQDEHTSDDAQDDPSLFTSSFEAESSRTSLNSTFSEIDISPLKTHAVSSHSRVSYGKRKLKQATDVMYKKQESIKKKVAEALNVHANELDREDEPLVEAITEQKAKDLDTLMDLLKEKMSVSKRESKVQLLTLVPSSWKIEKVCEYFSVTRYMVNQSRQLLSSQGILSKPPQRKGKPTSQETVNLVKEFYSNDEYSRLMPGKKDFVSVKRNVHEQKRLLLCNLSELHSNFKEKYPEVKISFSKFCELRPKWCITVGASGSHSVCVCTIHQNVKLMLDSVDCNKSYKEMIELIVCDQTVADCMLRRCDKCPGVAPLREFLQQTLDTNTESVTFNEWTTSDRAEIITRFVSMDEFIDIVIERIDHLTPHSFIAKEQSKFLNTLKERLPNDEVIVLGDFAENYQFVIQDEVQGFHWNSSQCTLHPIVFYYKSEENTISHSLCFITDDRNHDVDMVYEVISQSITFLKGFLPFELKKLHYFSDGCAGQYKNCKNFLNQTLHLQDFNIQSTWNFFATSHSKSPCDGIGGTLKRLTARASLQRCSSDQILTAESMAKFCQDNVPGVTTIYIASETVNQRRSEMESRYKLAKTVPGTRSFHYFEPMGEYKIGAKRISSDQKFALQFSFKQNIPVQQPLKIDVGNYLACKYIDGTTWIATVQDISNEEAEVKFLHPQFPAPSYFWPRREDVCIVPTVNVICLIESPSITGRSGRLYRLLDEDNNKILNSL